MPAKSTFPWCSRPRACWSCNFGPIAPSRRGPSRSAWPCPSRAGTSSPASLAVLAADNVELIPNKQAIEGLVQQRIAPAMKLPERQQDPLFYRGTMGPATFSADFRLHGQRITVDVASRVMLSQHTAEVEQRQSYSIAYEPVDHLTIVAARGLAAAKRIQVLCDGKPLAPVTPPEELAGNDPLAPVPCA